MLIKFNMLDCKPASTPLPSGADVNAATIDEHLLDGSTPYAELLGALLYLQATSRPDISFAVNTLSKHMSNPTKRHWHLAKHVLRYLKGSTDIGITYRKAGPLELQGYVDADFAADKDTRKSRTGFVFNIAGGAVHWTSKQQATVSTSTCEAEYIAAAAAAKEGIWLKRVLGELSDSKQHQSSVSLFCDNQAALHVASGTGSTGRVKHIDIAHHFLRGAVNRGQIIFKHVATADNPADAFTKSLARDKVEYHRKQIGVN